MRERCRTIIGAAAAAGLAMIFVAGTASAFPGGAHFVSNNTSVSCQTGCITADFHVQRGWRRYPGVCES
jgi:hypothetical protein